MQLLQNECWHSTVVVAPIKYPLQRPHIRCECTFLRLIYRCIFGTIHSNSESGQYQFISNNNDSSLPKKQNTLH